MQENIFDIAFDTASQIHDSLQHSSANAFSMVSDTILKRSKPSKPHLTELLDITLGNEPHNHLTKDIVQFEFQPWGCTGEKTFC